MTSYSLFELNEYIRRVLALNFPESVWIRCELSEVKCSRGHWYFQLVQKSDDNDEIRAQGHAVLWNRQFRSLEKKLGFGLHELLQEGREVLLLAKVEFHECFGLKLLIEDFDPAYTLGKLELKRRDTIRKLEQLNLITKNKGLALPPVIQRLAVITSETAAGYQDFRAQLAENSFGYSFYTQLFPTAVQGAQTEKEILAKLKLIQNSAHRFDAICIIRGGGGKLDLSVFDSYELSFAVAQCCLPVFTGIGHDVDETVIDLVAHSCHKTPTAVADFIVHHNLRFETVTVNLGQEIKMLTLQKIKSRELHLGQLWQEIDFRCKSNFRHQKMMLDYIGKEIPGCLRNILSKEKLKLENLEKSVEYLSPEAVLKRGFSLTLKDGKFITSAGQVNAGDELKTILKDGIVASIVKKTKQ